MTDSGFVDETRISSEPSGIQEEIAVSSERESNIYERMDALRVRSKRALPDVAPRVPWGLAMGQQDLIAEAQRILDKLKAGNIPRKPNILFIGLQGVGKSTLINSLHAAIDRTGYHEVALRGSYGEFGVKGRAAISLALRKYKLFDCKSPETQEHSFPCQPRLWDCPGLHDVEDDNISAIISLVVEGFIPNGTNMTTLRTFPARTLYQKYTHSKRGRCMDIVVYVHAATDPVPENLLGAIRGATQKDKQGCRQIPVLAVVTKTDQIDNTSKSEALQTRIEELTKLLGMYDVTERVFATSLYCKQVSPEMRRMRCVDEEMCKIWHRLLDPAYYPRPIRSRGSLRGMLDRLKST